MIKQFDKDLNAAVEALDMKFLKMDNDEVKKALFHLVDFIEDTLDEIDIYAYEELTDWCITYCQIKYKSSHPLNRFFDM